MRLNKLFMKDHKIWNDKRVPYDAKYVYCYIYAKGLDKTITHLDVGELQQTLKIKNKGLKKSLDILEKLNYLIYQDHTNGKYTITLN